MKILKNKEIITKFLYKNLDINECTDRITPQMRGLSKQAKKRVFLRSYAGIAQLVEHNLAKVGVASSSLVSRSRNSEASELILGFFILAFLFEQWYMTAGWQSGYAAACKAVDAGSIPTPACLETRNLKLDAKMKLYSF
jgi:hypothetical protein